MDRNVRLLGAKGAGDLQYTWAALGGAVSLYEGWPVFLNHAIGGGRTARKVQDYVGKICNARFDREWVRGNIQLAGPNRQWLTDLAASGPSDVSMSHVLVIRPAEEEDGRTLVPSIDKVLSVDIVAFPAEEDVTGALASSIGAYTDADAESGNDPARAPWEQGEEASPPPLDDRKTLLLQMVQDVRSIVRVAQGMGGVLREGSQDSQTTFNVNQLAMLAESTEIIGRRWETLHNILTSVWVDLGVFPEAEGTI